LTIHKTIDVIIATACINWNFELLHNDQDFDYTILFVIFNL